MAGGDRVRNPMDRLTWIVVLLIVAAFIEVVYPGFVPGLVHRIGLEVGLPW